jgi:hypothetical protein
MLLLHTKQVNNLWSKGNMNMFCPKQTNAPNPIFYVFELFERVPLLQTAR